MSFCLPTNLQTKFLDALKSGEIDPAKLMDMTSAERSDFFKGLVGEENAHGVNAAFESKLLLQDQKRGLVTWAKKMTGLSDKARADFVDKVSKLDKILSPEEEKNFLTDLAEQKLGVRATPEEAAKISQLTKNAQELKAQPTENLSGVSDEYLKAADELRGYISSLKPTTALASIGKNAAIIARNNLLMNPATPFKTSVSQFLNSAIDVFSRRLANLAVSGNAGDLAREANKEAWQTYRKTGLNTASMENLDDTGKLGEGHNFDVKTGMDSSNPVARVAEATVRKVAQVSTKIAIDWEHNISFTKFYQKTFFDAANIIASKIAAVEGGDIKGRTQEIFADAARIEPQTSEGRMVRLGAQKQAARVTSTNETWASQLALGVKNGINKGIPGLGDALMPIAKIPASIVANGIENAGVGIPLGAVDVIKGLKQMSSEDVMTKQQGLAQFANGVQRIGRTVGVLSAAAYFASQLNKNDFKTDRYGGTYVRIAGTWVNTEYISAISPALAGMMTIKKYSKPNQGIPTTAAQYVAGAGTSLTNLPGSSEIKDIITAITNTNAIKGSFKYADTFFTSRGEPAFIKQLMGPDPIKGLFFSTTGLPTQAELGKLGAK